MNYSGVVYDEYLTLEDTAYDPSINTKRIKLTDEYVNLGVENKLHRVDVKNTQRNIYKK